MHWIEDHSKANDSLHCIYVSVLLYGWSHFLANIEASLLKQALAALPAPPEADVTRGVKRAMFDLSDSLFLSSFFCPLMFPVCRSKAVMTIGWSIGVIYPYVEVGSLKATTPEPICSDVKSSRYLQKHWREILQ